MFCSQREKYGVIHFQHVSAWKTSEVLLGTARTRENISASFSFHLSFSLWDFCHGFWSVLCIWFSGVAFFFYKDWHRVSSYALRQNRWCILAVSSARGEDLSPPAGWHHLEWRHSCVLCGVCFEVFCTAVTLTSHQMLIQSVLCLCNTFFFSDDSV